MPDDHELTPEEFMAQLGARFNDGSDCEVIDREWKKESEKLCAAIEELTQTDRDRSLPSEVYPVLP